VSQEIGSLSLEEDGPQWLEIGSGPLQGSGGLVRKAGGDN